MKCAVAVVVAKQYSRSETAYPKWNPQSLVLQLRRVNATELGILGTGPKEGKHGNGQTRNAVFHTKCNEFPGPFAEMVFFQHAKRKLYTATGERYRTMVEAREWLLALCIHAVI